MQQDKEFLGKAPVGRLLFKLALPTVVAQLVNMLYNVVDRIYIGHIEGYGDLALTGVGVCLPLIMIVSAFAALVGSGGAPRASIAMGQRDYEKAERILGGCFGLQLILSAVLTAALLIWNKPLLLAFGASENTIDYATQYMNVYAIGTIFVQLTLGLNAFISAQGFTRTSMLSVIIGAVCNIVLDPIFIYGLGLGVRGAAIATVISQAASTLWIILFLCGKKTHLRLRPKFMLPIPRVVLPCIALGLATFVMQSSESVIAICFNTSLRSYGGDVAVGAMTILTSVMQFAMLPMQGVAQGAQPILSYNYGARQADRVKRTYKLLLFTCMLYSVALWALVMLFPQVFVGMFTDKPALADFAAPMLRIYYASMVLFGIQIACQMTFVSLGQALCSVVVAVMRKFVLLLPLIYIIPHLVSNPTTGVYLAEPIADVLAVTFTAILFAFVFRRSMKQIETPIA
ncbi:MAG: MATE family efflux transporter [Clostridia bacterium]|nr:MATE family efflux transporter [Clostridia bacterium]